MNDLVPTDGGGKLAARAYLAGLSKGSSRTTMRRALDQAARILAGEFARADTLPWERVRFDHMSALRATLADRYAPATANLTLTAVRGAMRAAWKLELVSHEDYARAADVPRVPGSRVLSGRALSEGEVRALFEACADDSMPAGARDAAAFAMMVGGGLRRSEAVGVQLADYVAESHALTVIGKGNRQRIVYLPIGAGRTLDDWIAIRGQYDGSILAPVSQTGRVSPRGMTAHALVARLRRRCAQAKIERASPHDLRRTFVTGLLDAGADVIAVQHLAGHASVDTTARYDRRGERAKRQASAKFHVPHFPRNLEP